MKTKKRRRTYKNDEESYQDALSITSQYGSQGSTIKAIQSTETPQSLNQTDALTLYQIPNRTCLTIPELQKEEIDESKEDVDISQKKKKKKN